MEALDPGGQSSFTLKNATATGTGQTFALPKVRYGSGAAREIVIEYIENIAPSGINLIIEAGNQIDANEDLTGSIEALVTVNTPDAKSIRVDAGRYGFIRGNLTVLPDGDISVRLSM